MFSENNRISARQAFRLLTYDLLGLGTLLLPRFLGRQAGRDGIFCIAIGIVAGLLYLKLLQCGMADMQVEFPLYLEQKLGRIGGRIIQLAYMIYFVLLAGYVAYIFADVVLADLLRGESFYLVLGILLALTAYGIWGGVEGRARVYEILFWFLMIPLFLMLLFAVDEIQIDYWAPVFTAEFAGVAGGGYDVFLFLSLVFLLLFLGGYVQKKEALLAAGRSALLFSGGVYAALYLILLGIFGPDALGRMNYPAVTLMSTVKISGGFLKRTDAFMFAIWFFTLYALLNSCVFYAGNVLARLSGNLCEKMQGQKKERMAALVALIPVCAAACCFYQSRSQLMWYESFLRRVGTPFLVAVPLLLAVCRLCSGIKWKRGAKRTALILPLVLLAGGVLSGCQTAELEDKNFPIELAVQKPQNFGGAWLKTQGAGNRVIDYRHLKVLILSTQLLEDASAMDEFLDFLEEKNEVPRNTYVVAAEDGEAILKLQKELGESVGNYLEEQFENVSQVKKQAYPMIGMLYQEQENRLETLFIPCVSEEEGKPVIREYRVWKRGKCAETVDSETALLAFFSGNRMDDYTLPIQGGGTVSLFAPRNEIIFREGQGKRQIVVKVRCSGMVAGGGFLLGDGGSGLGGSQEERRRRQEETELGRQIEAYMNGLAQRTLVEQEIDVSNSYRKLGGQRRDWYEEYRTWGAEYERDMEIVYEVAVDWVNL